MARWVIGYSFAFALLAASAPAAVRIQSPTVSSPQVQVAPPMLRRAAPPSPTASVAELETRGDQLRADKAFLDALDYYHAAMAKKPDSAALYVKVGITEIGLQRYREAGREFERALKHDRRNAIAYNNLGVIEYLSGSYARAIRDYQKAIVIDAGSASYFSNLGAAYFAKREFDRASIAYSRALELDPDVFERISRNGVQAQMSSPADRAHYDYVLAKLYARMGVLDRSLQCLRRAMEEGYAGIDNVYKDPEFSGLRNDARFTELMASRPPTIPE